ncbi:hypothetical protein FUAX_09410 [Fulvitalea axinellae]|uniref:YD repeat-containing protein n=1 Tax=Fulvitalea axinellae TaxID=1182444 RepID=A0AAU9D267_9BACT|nr:hypothetical protein FUAX_09410 [Fulvitalea axinellae]
MNFPFQYRPITAFAIFVLFSLGSCQKDNDSDIPSKPDTHEKRLSKVEFTSYDKHRVPPEPLHYRMEYAYTDNGNLLRNKYIKLDDEKKEVASSSGIFKYDAQGRLIQREVFDYNGSLALNLEIKYPNDQEALLVNQVFAGPELFQVDSTFVTLNPDNTAKKWTKKRYTNNKQNVLIGPYPETTYTGVYDSEKRLISRTYKKNDGAETVYEISYDDKNSMTKNWYANQPIASLATLIIPSFNLIQPSQTNNVTSLKFKGQEGGTVNTFEYDKDGYPTTQTTTLDGNLRAKLEFVYEEQP